MQKTGVYMDYTDVKVAYTIATVATVIQLDETVEMALEMSDSLEPWQASGQKFPRVLVDAMGSRGVSIRGGDCYKLYSIPAGTTCVITAKLNDAKNGIQAGCLLITASNAIKGKSSQSGSARKFASGDVDFACFSTDGHTDPIGITEVAST